MDAARTPLDELRAALGGDGCQAQFVVAITAALNMFESAAAFLDSATRAHREPLPKYRVTCPECGAESITEWTDGATGAHRPCPRRLAEHKAEAIAGKSTLNRLDHGRLRHAVEVPERVLESAEEFVGRLPPDTLTVCLAREAQAHAKYVRPTRPAGFHAPLTAGRRRPDVPHPDRHSVGIHLQRRNEHGLLPREYGGRGCRIRIVPMPAVHVPAMNG